MQSVMTGGRLLGVILCALFFYAAGTVAVVGDTGCVEELQAVKAKFVNYKTQALLAVKQIFDPEVTQICPSIESERKARSMQRKLEQMEKTLKDLAGGGF